MTLPTWVQTLHLSTWPYAVPILFGPPPPLKPGEKVETGTCVVVEHGQHRYALSAAHVFLAALEAVQSDAKTDVVIGPLQVALTQENVRFLDARRIDVATVPLTENEVARVEAAGYRVYRPAGWPPPTVAEGDGILMAGYPGTWRLHVSISEYDFRATTLLLSVKSVHHDEFIAHRDPAFSEPVRIDLEDVPPPAVGGCSGGPVFLVRQEPVLIPRLAGIVKEGWIPDGTEDVVLRFARLDVTLNADGTVRAP
jgi:hypothetical protein